MGQPMRPLPLIKAFFGRKNRYLKIGWAVMSGKLQHERTSRSISQTLLSNDSKRTSAKISQQFDVVEICKTRD